MLKQLPTILVVEQHALILENTAHVLNASGYPVITAHSYPAAIEAVRRAQPHIVVLASIDDRSGMDELEVANAFHAAAKKVVPVVFLESRPINLQLYGGPARVLKKPFFDSQLISAVESLSSPRLLYVAPGFVPGVQQT